MKGQITPLNMPLNSTSMGFLSPAILPPRYEKYDDGWVETDPARPCPELLTEDEAIRYPRLDTTGISHPQHTLPQSPASTWRKIDADDFWKLYNAAHESLKPLLALCRLAALRYSDALGLRWSNVRFDEGVLTFRPMKAERFAKVDARVPICAELRTILEELRQSLFPGAGFPGVDGYVVPRDAPKQGYEQFKRACRLAGLEPWSKPFHTLRKSCIYDWARLAPPNVVMEWATHTTLATTMKYYAKVHRADESLGQMQLLRPQAQHPILPGVVAVQ